MKKENIIFNSNSIIKLIISHTKLIKKIYIIKLNKKNIYIIKKALASNIKIQYIKHIKNKKLDYIKKYNSILCTIFITNQNNTNELINTIKNEKINKILILDRLQDPQNFAACLRTAEAFSINLVITNDKNCVKNTPLINKISNGANLAVKIIKEKNILNAIQILKDNNFEIIGISSKAKVTFNAVCLKQPFAIVMGSEKNGITTQIKKVCTNLYKINLTEKIKNINVSVATGIILSQIIN